MATLSDEDFAKKSRSLKRKINRVNLAYISNPSVKENISKCSLHWRARTETHAAAEYQCGYTHLCSFCQATKARLVALRANQDLHTYLGEINSSKCRVIPFKVTAFDDGTSQIEKQLLDTKAAFDKYRRWRNRANQVRTPKQQLGPLSMFVHFSRNTAYRIVTHIHGVLLVPYKDNATDMFEELSQFFYKNIQGDARENASSLWQIVPDIADANGSGTCRSLIIDTSDPDSLLRYVRKIQYNANPNNGMGALRTPHPDISEYTASGYAEVQRAVQTYAGDQGHKLHFMTRHGNSLKQFPQYPWYPEGAKQLILNENGDFRPVLPLRKKETV